MSGVIDALASHPSCDVLRKAELDDWLQAEAEFSRVSSALDESLQLLAASHIIHGPH